MLLIQNINLCWSKNERGTDHAKVRRQFPQAYLLEKNMPVGNVVVHCLHFWQGGERFIDPILENGRYGVQLYRSVEEVNLVNLSLVSCPCGFEVSFCYDERRSGKPFRRGHNKDYNNPQSSLYRKDCLNETAFVLAENQYGRILWNERRIDCDTGEWYYWICIYNILYLSDETIKADVFVANEPDYIYRQMVDL